MMSPIRRLIVTLVSIWLVLAIAGSIIIAVLNFPPPRASDVSQSISDTTKLITWLAWPIFSAVIVVVAGAVLIRRRDPSAAPAPASELRGNPRLAGAWIGVVGAVVLALAIFGTITLANEDPAQVVGVSANAGGSQGDNTNLEVQVIAQQWAFTYRYPSYGGFESAQLVLPVNARVTLHITSLDVVHSFWDPAIGVKADAVPLHDNVFKTQPTQIGTYRIVCGELCGLWHGSMSDDNMRVVSSGDFAAWAAQQQAQDAPVLKYLPPYSYTYEPAPNAYGT
jgi:cytochrome c oxidase subunit 2